MGGLGKSLLCREAFAFYMPFRCNTSSMYERDDKEVIPSIEAIICRNCFEESTGNDGRYLSGYSIKLNASSLREAQYRVDINQSSLPC